MVMILNDSFILIASLNPNFIHYHWLLCSLNMFKFNMIVNDSFLLFEHVDDGEW